MNNQVKRIAILGPESTGKSKLCEVLALHYQTLWVPEYARDYLPQLERKYTPDDIVEIYRNQFLQETDMVTHADKFLFIDTEFIIGKVWCESVFNFCPPWLDEMIVAHPYDLYLLTYPDLPWEYDPLRENPGRGEYFFNWYKKILEQQKLTYSVISGTGDARTQCAVTAIELFRKKSDDPEKF